MHKNAFSLMEVIFAIVILGILASIALPRFNATRVDAILIKGRSDVSAIRSGIAYARTARILQGQSAYPPLLEPQTEFDRLFCFDDGNTSIIEHCIQSGAQSGDWQKENNSTYRYYISSSNFVTFDYDNTKGTFTCSVSENFCEDLSH